MSTGEKLEKMRDEIQNIRLIDHSGYANPTFFDDDLILVEQGLDNAISRLLRSEVSDDH